MDKGFILALVFALIVGLFALSNSEKVIIDFILTNVEISQALVILISALLGALIVFVIGFIRGMKSRQKIKRLEKEIISLNEENNLMKDMIEKNTEEESELEIEAIEENMENEQ